MKYAIIICAVLLVTAFATDFPRAQGTAQSITASRVDVVQVASGYRASKVIGSTVYNESRDAIGTIDDLIVSPKDKVTYAILSVGGFLGLGTHLVAVPFTSLQVADKQMRLSGATRDSLKALPEFRYALP
ncbi:PRC-barrel domain-containing protein [Paraburkholderia sp. MMS20-SJTN17]|uniref:PRC-barrel domain-containing protein n=1 Tax=Paraburkholderia translucens TaxID=2886945 RepID=A0ABS8KLH4_9BURK|nr:PRC-barrel domain-containing protein [Paraburkholderia sp. MMS20-SJTN17]MCC8405293.1 PRC-barrel domain-containing protein [Paraburkholderia sp. MMS20-SJTN17]